MKPSLDCIIFPPPPYSPLLPPRRPVLRNFHEIKTLGFKCLVTTHFPWHPLVLLGWKKEVETTDILEENAKRSLPTAEMVTLRGVGTTHAHL